MTLGAASRRWRFASQCGYAAKVGRDSLLPLVPQAHKATNVSGDSPLVS